MIRGKDGIDCIERKNNKKNNLHYQISHKCSSFACTVPSLKGS